ncbi:hypothetical protein C5E41_09535 [Nocardia nova]|nr:hypothetical protein C5E41_09535 [Nocardia nova]
MTVDAIWLSHGNIHFMINEIPRGTRWFISGNYRARRGVAACADLLRVPGRDRNAHSRLRKAGTLNSR